MSLHPRFSLLSLMLIAALVCVSVAYWQTAKRAGTQQNTIRQLRDELGYLNVEDEKKAYVRQVPTYQPFVWKFRVYLPPEKKWNFFTVHSGGTSGTTAQATGRLTVTVSLTENKQHDNYFMIRLLSEFAGSGGSVGKEGGDRLLEFENYYLTMNSQLRDQREFSPDAPVELFQHKVGSEKLMYMYFSPSDVETEMRKMNSLNY